MAREAAQDSRSVQESRPDIMFINATTSLFSSGRVDTTAHPSHIEISSAPAQSSTVAARSTAPGGIQFDLNSLFGQAKGALEQINLAKPTATAPDDTKTKKALGQPSEGGKDGFFGWNLWAGSRASDPGKENRGNAHAGVGSRTSTAGLSPKISQNPFMRQNSMLSQQGEFAKGQEWDASKEHCKSAEGQTKRARRVSSEMQVSEARRALFPAPLSASPSDGIRSGERGIRCCDVQRQPGGVRWRAAVAAQQ